MRIMHGRRGLGGFSMLIVAVMGGVLFFAAGLSYAGLIIVSDGFSGIEGSTIHGRTPDTVDEPGGTWYSVGTGNPSNNPFAPGPPTIRSNTAQVTVNNSAYISIQSAGSYVKPTKFTISADLEVGTISGNNLGVGLGFNDDKTAYDVSQEISLAANGNLNFKQILIAPYDAADFGGNAFNPNSFYHLAYTVDTSTGGVSGITLSNGLGSQSYTLSTTAFTDAKTAFAGIFSNASAELTSGNIDNFLISIPEPASLSLLAGGVLLLLRRRVRG